MAAVEAHRDMLQRTSQRTLAEQERVAQAKAAAAREKAAVVGGRVGVWAGGRPHDCWGWWGDMGWKEGERGVGGGEGMRAKGGREWGHKTLML